MSIAQVEFDYLRRLVRDYSAIEIDAGKEYLAELRLSPLLVEHGARSVQEFLQSLRTQQVGCVHRRVVDAMTNNETWFFRDHHPFGTLSSQIIPEMITRRASERRLHIWSAACSTGQEPYSIAMILHERFQIPGWQHSILATDIAESVLARARSGLYSQLEINRGLPANLLVRYFLRDGANWAVRPEVRNMVLFQMMNLAEAWKSLPPMDIVLMRNVLIYFNVPIRRQILAWVRRVLRPDGYLLLGSAETTLSLDGNFERVPFEKCAFYRVRDTL
jgi:chemotaxis protein methyltransferase CheR